MPQDDRCELEMVETPSGDHSSKLLTASAYPGDAYTRPDKEQTMIQVRLLLYQNLYGNKT
jgi:hypothetical protein